MAGTTEKQESKFEVQVLEERGKRALLKIAQGAYTIMKVKEGETVKGYNLFVLPETARLIETVLQQLYVKNFNAALPAGCWKTVEFNSIRVGCFENIRFVKGLNVGQLHTEEESPLEITLIVWRKQDHEPIQYAFLDAQPYTGIKPDLPEQTEMVYGASFFKAKL